MNWINILVILLFTSFAIIFALSNVELVQIGLAGLKSMPLPFYIPVFITFFLGFVGGVLSLAFSRRKHKREIRELRHENEMLSQEVENLRNIPLQDDL
ncbi:MAG: LapA family protein [Mariprofundaceae bacterium]